MENIDFKEYRDNKKTPPLEVNKNFLSYKREIIESLKSERGTPQEILLKNELKFKDELIIHQAKMASLGEILENIVHQWRQPLSMMSIVISTAQLKLLEMNIAPDMEVLNEISQYITHLSDSVDDFREYFKEDKSVEKYCLSECYRKTVKLLSSKINKYLICLVEDIEIFEIKGYKREMIHVLMNIYSNALDAFEEMKSSSETKIIFTKITKDTTGAVITIKDTAGGIPETCIDRVFEAKFTTKGDEGTGVGLYIVNEIIVKHMKGRISVENTYFEYEGKSYKGALFTIRIPFLEC